MSKPLPTAPGLSFRELTAGDLPALRRILQDAAVMYAYNGPFSEEEVQGWLARQQQRYREWGFGLWAVEVAGRVVGQCGLTLQPWKDREVLEVGYLFEQAAWHRGLAVRAARACKRFAFEVLEAPALHAIIRDSNLPSQQVARRLRMRPMDEWVKRYRGKDMPHLLFRVEQ